MEDKAASVGPVKVPYPTKRRTRPVRSFSGVSALFASYRPGSWLRGFDDWSISTLKATRRPTPPRPTFLAYLDHHRPAKERHQVTVKVKAGDAPVKVGRSATGTTRTIRDVPGPRAHTRQPWTTKTCETSRPSRAHLTTGAHPSDRRRSKATAVPVLVMSRYHPFRRSRYVKVRDRRTVPTVTSSLNWGTSGNTGTEVMATLTSRTRLDMVERRLLSTAVGGVSRG